MYSCALSLRNLGAEQVDAYDDDADCYHEVRVGAGVALIEDTAKRHDALLNERTDEQVGETDKNVDEEDDRQVGTAVLARLCRQVERQQRHFPPP